MDGSWSNRILQYIHLNRCLIFAACAFLWRNLVFWDDYLIDLDLLDCNEQLLNVAVKTDDSVNWIFSATYASPNAVYR